VTRPADGAIAELAIAGDLPAYVIHPSADVTGPIRTVFLTGSCTHPLDSIKPFQAAAARHGGLVALQGDLPCKGKDGRLRKWSTDAAGAATTGLTLMGYSQGAERAEWLGHRFHGTYTHFVLMAGPGIPVPSRLQGARGVVLTAGHGDVRENMAIGAKRLQHAKIPAIYMEIPTITHGELAPGADAVVSQAFDWLATATPPEAKPARREAKRR
jgi:hypothetical protein